VNLSSSAASWDEASGAGSARGRAAADAASDLELVRCVSHVAGTPLGAVSPSPRVAPTAAAGPAHGSF
jgi:hypothetical protein